MEVKSEESAIEHSSAIPESQMDRQSQLAAAALAEFKKEEKNKINANMIHTLNFVFSSDDRILKLAVTQHLRFLEYIIANRVKKYNESELASEKVLDVYKLGLKLNSATLCDTCLPLIKKNKDKIFRNIEEFGKICKESPELIYNLVMSNDN